MAVSVAGPRAVNELGGPVVPGRLSLWEGRISKRRGYILGGRGRYWEGRIDSGNVTYSCRKGGYILEGRGRLWECRI